MKRKSVFIINIIIIIILSILSAPKTYAKSSNSSFWIEYIDVGQGDAALIQCDGEYMLIDGGPSDASSTIYSILKNKGVKILDYIIATHPDADHIGGLSAALNYSRVARCLCPVTSHDSKSFQNLKKYLYRQGITITLPKVGAKYTLGSATITIIGPVKTGGETNNDSIVTMVQYGANKFLFAGDAENEEEEDIMLLNNNLDCDVLKVGHHGSSSSTSVRFLGAVKPEYAIISVGKDNSYGHPVQSTLDTLTDMGVKIYRTDLKGDIIVSSDGKNLTITTERNAEGGGLSADEKKKVPDGTTYILNNNSLKFHLITCDSVDKIREYNRAYSDESAEVLVTKGYSPCKRCNPK